MQPMTPRGETNVYKTGSGTIFRVSQEPGGHMTVQLLKATEWQPAPIGMAGLRVAPTTSRLTARQVKDLPA
jgi:hypothetical protein